MRSLVLLLPVALIAGACSKPPASAPSTASATALDAGVVPQGLRHLTPLARKWGVGDDVERNALHEKATPAEKEELRAAVDPYRQQINAWLDSFGQNLMPEEAAAFMYMLEGMDEMGI